MYGLDLFSGIGGLTKALEPWVRPVAYCERDRYCQAVLLSRMASGSLPVAPIWDDVRTLSGNILPNGIEVVYGGFPCQDISVAGRGAGLAGERSGLFFEIVRLVSEIRPSFVFLENVPAIRIRGGDIVAKELASLRYDCRWFVIPAPREADFSGKRWFLLAKAMRSGLEGLHEEGGGVNLQQTEGTISRHDWKATPRVLRANHGIPCAMDRIRALGNAVVPQQAQEAFKRLMGLGGQANEQAEICEVA